MCCSTRVASQILHCVIRREETVNITLFKYLITLNYSLYGSDCRKLGGGRYKLQNVSTDLQAPGMLKTSLTTLCGRPSRSAAQPTAPTRQLKSALHLSSSVPLVPQKRCYCFNQIFEWIRYASRDLCGQLILIIMLHFVT